VKLLKIIDWAQKLADNSISILQWAKLPKAWNAIFILNMNVERRIGKRLHGYNKFQRFKIRLKESVKLVWAAHRTQSLYKLTAEAC